MPKVPYQAYSTEQPTSGGTPKFGVETPAAAFGSTVASATAHLGDVIGRAGDELYQRAEALQKLRNDALANDADAQYMMRVGELHANFNSLQGKPAVDAYPQYVKDLQSIREEIGASVPNDAARRLYDNRTKSTMGRTIFNGAGHAATENKRWALGAATARIDAHKDNALWAPMDDRQWTENTNFIANEVRQKGLLAGWGEDQINNQISSELSGAWSNRIIGLSKTNPFAAQEMLEKNRTEIRGQDLEKVEQQVRLQMRSTGSRNISDAVNQGWAPYMKSEDMARAVGVEDALIRVMKQAQRDNPDLQFTIGDKGGKRTQETQAGLVALGRSWTYNSDHTTGRALDLIPIGADGKLNYNDRATMEKIQAAMKSASAKLGIPLAEKSPGFQAKDAAHVSLPRDYDVATAPKPVEEPLASRLERAKQYASLKSGQDSVFDDFVGERVSADFNRAKVIKRDQDYTNNNTIDGAIVGNYGGKLPTTVEELKATDPKVAAAWDGLDETHQRRVLRSLAANAKGDVTWSEPKLRRYQTIKGMAQADPAEFMSLDVVAEDLPNSARKELINQQMKLKSNAEGDPRVTKALGILQGDMNAAGITKAQNKERFYQFTGALQDAIQDWQTENKRAPKAEEVQAIGARLLQQQATPWMLNPWSKTEMFEVPVPEADAEKIKNDSAWGQLGITPDDRMIQRIYTRQLYQKLYGSPKSDTMPKPPMSK